MYERRTTFCRTSLLACRTILRASRSPPSAPRPFGNHRFFVVVVRPVLSLPLNMLARLWPRFFYFSRFQSAQTGFKIPPAEKSECLFSHFRSYTWLTASSSSSSALLLLSSLLRPVPPDTPLDAVNPGSSHRPTFRRGSSPILPTFLSARAKRDRTLIPSRESRKKMLRSHRGECITRVLFVASFHSYSCITHHVPYSYSCLFRLIFLSYIPTCFFQQLDFRMISISPFISVPPFTFRSPHSAI